MLEALLLVAFHRATGRGVVPSDFLVNMLSGLCLMGALREALVGAHWMWIATGLLGALVAHVTDLGRRWW